MASCGIDFGTTNSLIAYVDGNSVHKFLDESLRPHPSAVWYHGNTVRMGREARDGMGGQASVNRDEFVRSPKANLGVLEHIHVGSRAIRSVEVASHVLKYLKKDVSNSGVHGVEFDQTVVTIPVDMRGPGRRALREASRLAEIGIRSFVHEPFAALYGYVKRQGNDSLIERLQGRIALVFDWGGGTLDLTLCEGNGNTLVQIQSKGNNHVGGDNFDERLMHEVIRRHHEEHGWSQPRHVRMSQMPRLLSACEIAKIQLSTLNEWKVFVPQLFDVRGEGQDLKVSLSRADLQNVAQDFIDRGMREIAMLLDSAGLKERDVEFCLPTGGMVAMPAIKERLLDQFGPSRCPFVDDADHLIAEGAAWIAAGDVPIRLGKNLEFWHASQTWVPILLSGQYLPHGGRAAEPVVVDLYCADPTSGYAEINLARPKRARNVQSADQRQSYTLMRVPVIAERRPLSEKIRLSLTIDPDLIVQVEAHGAFALDEQWTEIHDLEFGIEFVSAPSDSNHGRGRNGTGTTDTLNQRIEGAVRRLVSAQLRAHSERWLRLTDRVWIDGRQTSLQEEVQQIWIDAFGRPPDSVITLLQERALCVRRNGEWVAAIPGEVTAPVAPERSRLGPVKSVVLRSNVTSSEQDWSLVPGPIVKRVHPHFLGTQFATSQQLDEIAWEENNGLGG